MEIPKSNLEFLDFLVLQTEYLFIEPKKETDIKDVFNAYHTDVNFDKTREINQDNSTQFNVHIVVNINTVDKPLPGYQIKVKGVALFQFIHDDQLGKKEESNLKNISALSITINALRNYVSQITAHGPFGKFVLPAVNVNDLIKAKIKETKTRKP
jgi:preprotein translocase subunit SecB